MFKNYEKYKDFRDSYAWKVLIKGDNFWVGAEASTIKDFYWYDDNSSLANWLWLSNEPNNYFGDEFCSYAEGITFLMHDVRCEWPYKTICEYSD